MIAKWREGYDVVYAKRIARDGENFLKLATSRAFYFVQRKLSSIDIPANVSDFRLIDRKVVEAFKAMPERDRFVRAMFSWIGFRQTSVEFHREERFAGQTKYSWGRLTRLAMDGVIGYSDAPLRAVLWLGGAVSVCAMLYGFQVVAKYLIVGTSVEGWSSLAVLISLLAGMNLMTVGVVGLYVGRIHNEVKQRPLYLVAREVGFGRLANSFPGTNRMGARAS